MHFSVRDTQSISGCLFGIAMDIIEVHSIWGLRNMLIMSVSIKSIESSENVNSFQFDLEYQRQDGFVCNIQHTLLFAMSASPHQERGGRRKAPPKKGGRRKVLH